MIMAENFIWFLALFCWTCLLYEVPYDNECRGLFSINQFDLCLISTADKELLHYFLCSFLKAKSEVSLEDVNAIVKLGLELFCISQNKLYVQVVHCNLYLRKLFVHICNQLLWAF